MTKAQRNAIVSPATGLLIYQTNNGPGFYFYRGTQWVSLSGSGWSLTGNAGTDTTANFLGTTDDVALVFKVNNTRSGFIDNGTSSTAFGYRALFKNTGSNNAAFGRESLANNTTGYYNVGFGMYAMYSNTSGFRNTALGVQTLYANTTGNFNVAVGNLALFANTDGFENVGVGNSSLNSNTLGAFNVSVGSSALQENVDGSENTATGYSALMYNSTADGNTANGAYALYFNTLGYNNTAQGIGALYHNTTAYANTAVGANALYTNNSGGQNTAIGYDAGSYNDANTYCTFVGYDADQSVATDFINATALGNGARITSSNQIRLGNPSINSIGGYQNWTNVSDGRYKKDVAEKVVGLEFINSLRPVVYHLDITGLNHFFGYADSVIDITSVEHKEKIVYSGFIAQEVEAAAQAVNYSFSGVDAPENENGLYGLRYAEFVVPLVKAVQELSIMNEEKDAQIHDLEERIERLESMMNGSVTESQVQFLNALSADQPKLEQNTPNPFTSRTTIRYYVPEKALSAQLKVMDNNGAVLFIKELDKGYGIVEFDAVNAMSGSYLYALIVNDMVVETKQMILNK